ncbi:MAG: hypothetical protein JO165_13520 [Candidatus Eremiobacteraeota bacterium]|nr:hypothetical protein [Candidatus Eremiobacteraeota bacterium]
MIVLIIAVAACHTVADAAQYLNIGSTSVNVLTLRQGTEGPATIEIHHIAANGKNPTRYIATTTVLRAEMAGNGTLRLWNGAHDCGEWRVDHP